MDTVTFDANALYRAYKATLKASPMKPLTQKYEMNWLDNITALYDELNNKSYEPSKKIQFIIRERGKTRLIRAAPVRDKVVQHAFCDEVLLPLVKPRIIYDNYASLKDRGVSMARKRFEIMLHRFYRKHRSNKGYILLMDFSGYYDNLRHDLVYETMSKLLSDENHLWLLRKIIDSSRKDVSFLTDEEVEKLYTGKYKSLDYANVPKDKLTGEKHLAKGLDIGDQVAQIIAIYFPTRLDNYIKIVRREKFYGRYMDDSFILSDSREHLLEMLDSIERITSELGIILNKKKVRILPLHKTFTYLQIKYFLTDSGRVVKRISPKRVTAMRRKLKKLSRMVKNGERSYEYIRNMFRAWRKDFYRLMSKLQRQNMDNLYNSLFSKEEAEYEKSLQVRPRYRQIYWSSRS